VCKKNRIPHRKDATDQVTGKALENFVAMEVLKHAGWSAEQPRLFHYRQGRDEIDLVLERRSGDSALWT
jgi:predicted AAA+ superfamily ATPase